MAKYSPIFCPPYLWTPFNFIYFLRLFLRLFHILTPSLNRNYFIFHIVSKSKGSLWPIALSRRSSNNFTDVMLFVRRWHPYQDNTVGGVLISVSNLYSCKSFGSVLTPLQKDANLKSGVKNGDPIKLQSIYASPSKRNFV